MRELQKDDKMKLGIRDLLGQQNHVKKNIFPDLLTFIEHNIKEQNLENFISAKSYFSSRQEFKKVALAIFLICLVLSEQEPEHLDFFVNLKN